MLTVIELVRHAGAESRQDQPDSDRERPLDEVGAAQAEALADDLGGSPAVALIVCADALRSRQSVEPLARARSLDITEDERLSHAAASPVTDDGDAWIAAAWQGGRALELIDEVLAELPGERSVLCSHGDVVPATLALLVGRDALGLAEVRCPKAGRFTLSFDGRRCVSAVPVAPPRIGPLRQER